MELPALPRTMVAAMSPVLMSAQGNVQRTMAEAAQISTGTLDYSLLLGGALGLLFGIALPANLSGNLDLANTIVQGSLFGRVASVVVVFIISVRVILARGMQDQSWVSVDDGHHVMLRHIAASSWAAVVALFCFLLAAALGYAVGLLLGLPGLAGDMLAQLADNYTVSALVHVTLRVLVEAAAVAWISFFDMILLSAHREDLSRSITRKLLLLVSAVIGIEALDAWLYWAIL
jgi:hypothetical protein